MSVHISSDAKPNKCGNYLRMFKRDEEGGVLVLTLLLMVLMLVMGGMAVDLMRFEERRVVLQNVSDRAVLAAAELDQTVPTKDVINGYFDSEGLRSTIQRTRINDQPGDRAVEVVSALDINTFYMRLIGIDTLTAPAVSAAIEGTGNIEISLVLDISGSMGTVVSQEDGTSGRRIDLLRDAAINFTNDLLIPEYRDEISMSLIMYSAQVNIGDELYRAINTTPDTILKDDTLIDLSDLPTIQSNDPDFDLEEMEAVTNPSRCIEFEPQDFATVVFDTSREYQQTARLDRRTPSSNAQFTLPECPEPDSTGFVPSIIPMTQDAATLVAAIGKLEPTFTTSIHMGMKWGVSLVDPSMRGILANVPSVDPAFAGVRPADYNDANSIVDTTKYVILMTDGRNVSSPRIRDSYYDDPFWRRAFTNYPLKYWRENRNDHPEGLNPAINQIIEFPDSAGQYNTWLQQTCDAARSKGIVVITISMGAPEDGANQMKQCAYTENYFYDAEDEAIGDVFESIAKQITDLRLSL
ncbi:MAG: pilus assembly protein TadG-related protein [Pseudomonadota bacterium]